MMKNNTPPRQPYNPDSLAELLTGKTKIKLTPNEAEQISKRFFVMARHLKISLNKQMPTKIEKYQNGRPIDFCSIQHVGFDSCKLNEIAVIRFYRKPKFWQKLFGKQPELYVVRTTIFKMTGTQQQNWHKKTSKLGFDGK